MTKESKVKPKAEKHTSGWHTVSFEAHQGKLQAVRLLHGTIQ